MISIDRILVPVDFSDASVSAAKFAASLAEEHNAKLYVIHVVEELHPSLRSHIKDFESFQKETLKYSGNDLSKIIPNEMKKSISVQEILEPGHPVHVIGQKAKELDIDLIVIGTHGRTESAKIMLGSVADKIAHRSPCSVLLFRPFKARMRIQDSKSPLKDKIILVVDDEPDVLQMVAEELDMCLVHRAQDYETALQYLVHYTYDAVILDIMGVRGFELLKKTVGMGYPAIIFTAHALTPESLKESMKLGAVSFLPKEKLPELKEFLEDAVAKEGKAIWKKFFDRIGSYLDIPFGPGWKERDKFFKEFEESVRMGEDKASQ